MLFLFLLFVLRIVESQKTSPCPSTFSYREKSETSSIPRDVWAGEITLRTVEDLAGVFINVILDKPSESLGSFFGEVTTSDNREYVITNTKYNLEAGPAVIVEIFVKYDTNEEVPGVKIIRLNGKTICSTKVHEVYLRPTLPTLHISQSKNSSSRPGDVYEEPPRHEDENRPQPSHRPGEGLSLQRPSGGPRPIEGVYSYGTQPSAFIISHAPSHRPSSHSDDREHTTERHTTSRITTERYNNDNEYNSDRRTTGVHSSYDQGYSTESHTSSRRTTERNNGDNEYSNIRTTERYNSNESNGYQPSRDERTTERNNPRTTRRTTTKTPNHSIGSGDFKTELATKNRNCEIGDFPWNKPHSELGTFGGAKHNQPRTDPDQHNNRLVPILVVRWLLDRLRLFPVDKAQFQVSGLGTQLSTTPRVSNWSTPAEVP
ncbi:unnamed protein product [Callosobruchus maculatus]|uniref:Serine protease gd N-terminal domain-containing protein n=1 Tax=Callosobruchus maculatus TaxID=64391 RepID=A0A653C355_CALMS|nr:unnamed protein product [Callosobruchus maculatus]